jgi:hypothetical protein
MKLPFTTPQRRIRWWRADGKTIVTIEGEGARNPERHVCLNANLGCHGQCRPAWHWRQQANADHPLFPTS